MAEIKYIDRRTCRRVVPMKVLCLGASRTGTESMRRALIQLGYIETYHGFAAAFECPLDCEMWLDALNAKFKSIGKPFGRSEWDKLLGHCQAVTDIPAMCFGPELIEAYPEAKVILTNRDIESWYISFTEAAVPPFYFISVRIIAFVTWAVVSPFRFTNPTFQICLEDFWRVNPRSPNGVDPSAAKDVFVEHYSLIRKLVPPARLLEYKVQDGWEPLCEFLGCDVPDMPFPRGNEKEYLGKMIHANLREQAKIILIRISQVVGAVVLAWLLERWMTYLS